MFDENIEELKSHAASVLKISIEELERRILEVKRNILGIASDKMAILYLLSQEGSLDPEIIEKVTAQYAIMRLSELRPGMRGVSVLGRIIRITPLRQGKNTIFLDIIIEDNTGRAAITLFGSMTSIVKDLNLKVGTPILIKRGRVGRALGSYIRIFVDEDTKIEVVESDRFKKLVLNLPPPRKILDVTELLNMVEKLQSPETLDVDIIGRIAWIGDIKEFTKQDGRIFRNLTMLLLDRKNPNDVLRAVLWGSSTEFPSILNIRKGDTIIIRGGRVKINEYKLASSSIRNAVEVHLSGFSSIEKLAPEVFKLKDLTAGMRGVAIYVFAISPPRIGSFMRNEEERRYLTIDVADDTATMRMVVWNENLIDDLSSLTIGDKLWVYGNIKMGRGDLLEIHVPDNGDIKVDPPDFPLNLSWESVKSFIDQAIKDIGERKLIQNFEEITLDSYFDIEGYLEFIEKNPLDRGPIASLILSDGKNRIKALIWNENLADKIDKLSIGSKLHITNVKTPRDIKDRELVIHVGNRSDIEIVEESNSMTNKSTFEPEKSIESFILLRDAPLGAIVKTFGNIIAIDDISFRKFCSKCNQLIIRSENGEDICESGHISKGISKLTLILEIEDGKRLAEVIITGSFVDDLLEKLKIAVSDVLVNREKILEQISNDLIGKVIILSGRTRPSGRQNIIRIYADSIRFADPKKDLNIITDLINKYQKNIEESR
ncbi:MAG: OB-fold nucleic acid binding domain-containing protein [Candidatus Njordarchaeum guaymaensis]